MTTPCWLTWTSAGNAAREGLRKLLDEAQALDKDNLKEFQESLSLVPSVLDLVAAPTGELNILQAAAQYGLAEHVKLILDFDNLNPNMAPNGTCPALLLAAKAGKHEVLKVFRDHKAASKPGSFSVKFNVRDPSDGSTIAHALLRKPIKDDKLSFEKPEDPDEYQKCLEVLTDDLGHGSDMAREIRQVVNVKDVLDNTALHYATQMWSQSVVRLLLELGANIGIKNIYGEVPINHILPETMEDYLNKFCLDARGNVTNENFQITSHFDFLVPAQDKVGGAAEENGAAVDNWMRKDPEVQVQDEDQERVYLPETDGLWHMSQSKKHQHLLKHPVIALFLWLKWKRMSTAYNRNLAVYTAFVAVVTGYIFTLYAGKSIRAESFLTENCDSNVTIETDGPARDSGVLWYILIVLLIILIGRETLQLGVAPRRYFFSIENWVEIALISLTGVLLFHGGYACHIEEKRHVAAIIIVLSWSELITMIGRHPNLTTYNIYVTMFYKVLQSFIMFLAWYCLFIIAFGLGFYILLHNDNPKDPEAEYPFFDNLGLALVKTFTMFVGELEFADLPFKTPVGYLFLLSFVFLIVVVMMNLLNGLAVSDTGVIRHEAEIYAYKCQVEIISYLEAMMLGDPFNFLSNWPSYVWLRHFPSCSPIGGLYRIPSIRKLMNFLTNAKNILLFGDVNDMASDYSFTFYPNRDSFRCSAFCCCGDKEEDQIPETILESAKEAILTLRKEKDEQEEQEGLEKRLAAMESALQELLTKLVK